MKKFFQNWIFIGLVLILITIGVFFSIPQTLSSKIGLKTPPFLQKPYKLGLDLQGGIHFLYKADLSQIDKKEWKDAIDGLRDIIERRVNLFGIQEPVVQVEKAKEEYRLIVELAGITDFQKAIEMIGQTPYLEFREELQEEEKKKEIEKIPEEEINKILEQIKRETAREVKKEEISQYFPFFKPTKLTGRYLKRAEVQFDPTTYKPLIGLEFNEEGAKIFEELTEKNVNKKLAIYIDGALISSPVVQEKISGGKAQITGIFTIEEARFLARNLNAGALPVPIELISHEVIGPSLGKISIEQSLFAGLIGFLLVILFMIFIYRFSGFLTAISLLFYIVLILSLFKLIPVTLTLAGIAGLILSLGMAVDANILIFERLREEKEKEKDLRLIIDNAFSRAWPAIRDGNLTTLIICFILFLISSGFAQGFAITLAIGQIVNIFTAIIIMKLFMRTFSETKLRKFEKIWTR